MKPAKNIAPPDWAQRPETRKLMKVLNDGVTEPQALFVGGCVRNQILNEVVEDIDIATKFTPDNVTKRLESVRIKTIPTGIDHGTVMAVIGERTFEITTLRRDVETDGRRAVVAFSQNWEEDAQRRDFTMNTLLMDLEGNIYDPTGQGLSDLEAHHLRFVGNPATRIAEDVLRILRFFRFHALYGKGEPDAEALKACRDQADKIPQLSRERITQEFFKILSVEKPMKILNIMFENNVLKEFSQFQGDINVLRDVCHFQNLYGLRALAPRLLVLAGLEMENIESMKSLLLIPKLFLKDIQAILSILDLPDLVNDHAVKVAVYKYGRTNTAQALMIELAQDRVMNGYAPKALEIVQNWEIPTFPVTGEDLMEDGIVQGPELGKKLTELEKEWVDRGFRLT